MNEHDSEKIGGLLGRRGLVPAASVDEADLFLLNTCSVREKAVQKVFSRLGELKQRKQAGPGFWIGVVGCVAQQEGEAILRRAPYVDLVVGTHQYHALPDLVDELGRSARTTPPNGRVATAFLDDSGTACGRRRRPVQFVSRRCDHHGGLQQALRLLHRAAYPRS